MSFYNLIFKVRKNTSNQEKFVKELIDSTEIEPDKVLVSAYKAAYSTVGRSYEEMLSKATQMASELKEYINDVKTGKKVISDYDLRLLGKIRDNISQHKMANKLLKPQFIIYDANTDEDKAKVESGETGGLPIAEELYHEFQINWEYQGLKCKSLLDSLHLDYKNKRYTIMDLKTTAKIYHFEDSMKEYDYIRQLCYYRMAVEWYLENELGEDPKDWDFECYIIAIDTINQHDIRVFRILRSDFEKDGTRDRICNALVQIKWHFETDKWEHSMEYYLGNGIETLNL